MDLNKLIVDFVKAENGRPIPAALLATKLIEANPDLGITKEAVYGELDVLEKDNVIRRTREKNHIVLKSIEPQVDMSTEKVGIISINRFGHGFIRLEGDETDSWYVFHLRTNDAFNGDKVKFAEIVRRFERNPDKKIDAVVLEVVERAEGFTQEEHENNKQKYENNRNANAR